MKTTWSEKTNTILTIGRSLEDVGVCNWALTREQALRALDQFKAEEIGVLGGDVYEQQGHVLQSNFDNWYCKREGGESHLAFASRSVEKAQTYIRSYRISPDRKCFFVIVPSS